MSRTHMRRTSTRPTSGIRLWRLGVTLALALSPVAGISAADQAPVEEVGTLPITEITVFKDGHAFVLHEGRLAVNGEGDVITRTVPAPVLGSLWTYTTTSGARLKSVTAGERTVRRTQAALTLRQLLEANIGAEAVLRFDLAADKAGSERQGRILGVPSRAGNGLAGDIVLVGCRDGVRAFDLARVVEVVLAGEHQTELVTEEKERLLSFDLDWRGRTPAEAEVGMAYLQKGLRWIPSYRVEIDGQGSARLRLQGTLVNELADLDGSVVHLVVGVPSFRFAETLDPMALREAVEELGEHFQRSSRTASVFSNAVMTQAALPVQQAQPVAARGTDLDDPGRSEDLYVFSLDPLRLRKGDRMTVPIAEATLSYRDVYTLDLPPTPPAEVWQQYARGREDELARLSEVPKVQHAVRLANSGPHPLTTAPALILEDGRLLGQGMTTYAPVGSSSDLAITTAVEIPVRKSEREVARKHNAVQWESNSYARIELEGTITLTNRGATTVEVEVTRHVLGAADSVSHDGVIERSNVFEEASFATTQPAWWSWYSWPYWWHHLNGIGRIRWTLTLEPGQTIDLAYTWSYYWR
jgi:hypothetical protein